MEMAEKRLEQIADGIIDLVLESTYIDCHLPPSADLPIAVRKRNRLVKEIVKEVKEMVK
jgi:hypothetical protein